MKRGFFIFCLTASCVFVFIAVTGYGQDSITILSSGNVGIGTTDPSEKLEVNGTIKSNERIEDKTGPIAPVGSIVMWPKEIPPVGWLECDGDPVSRETYADLFSVIGGMYGPGDESTTFNLPDMQGMFVRGWDHDANEDPDKEDRTDRGDDTEGPHVGTRQPDAFKSHRHNIKAWGSGSGAGIEGYNKNSRYDQYTDYSGGSETRPKNIYLMFIIKY